MINKNTEKYGLNEEDELTAKSTTISLGRNIKDYAYPNGLSDEDRLIILDDIIQVCKYLESDLAGFTTSLVGMEDKDIERIQKEGIMFDNQDALLNTAGFGADWPSGRGIHYNENKSLYIWIN